MISETIDEIRHTQPGFDILFSPVKEYTVYADRVRIAQVLINFLTNAIKYSPHFNMVTVKCSVIESNVIVSVIDSGIGISKNDQEKIFQRFYRVEGKDEKTFPGFGIGLFIAAEIIQRHNGQIGVESEPGKGSIFSFSLPLEN
jgi:signal transduction histidine kinase